MFNTKSRVCLVTGSTSGIGREMALALAGQQFRVIVSGKSGKKCRQTAQEISRISGNPHIHYFSADLADLAQVRRLVQQVHDSFPTLDVLINNAGIYSMRHLYSVDGYELTLAVNHLAHFLLTNLLLDSLLKSDDGRIITVSSQAHERGTLDFNDLFYEQHYDGFKAYARSKLANILFTYHLAEKLQNTAVTANVFHPGFVRSNFGKNNGLLRFWARRLIKRGAVNPAQGAGTGIFLAADDSVKSVSGKYWVDKKPANSSPLSYDKGLAQKLWCESCDYTNYVKKD
ncbi:MAG TPA: SDR family oxidoreductase [bacterium]|nr:SDR family oxidoreductase [bacterium]HPN42398.1 SDR family oxidoreductase [bacterium]